MSFRAPAPAPPPAASPPSKGVSVDRPDPMAGFERQTLTVNGVKTNVLTAGRGAPLVFLHGAGIWHGLKFALPWAEKFRVIVPIHPGLDEADDDPGITELHDYVMHYLGVFDALGIDKFRLVGFSLGGWLAAKFAVEHGHRVERLVLVGPAGLRGKEKPRGDFFTLPPEQIPSLLVSNFDTIEPYLPDNPNDLDFIGARYREGGTLARLLWEHPYDTKLPRYLHRLTMPTLLVWGEEDRLIPVQNADLWRQFLPKADIQIFKGAGHLVLDERREAVDAVQRFLL
jgi:pimeloyl-ACP methyl ester carboxylesterase